MEEGEGLSGSLKWLSKTEVERKKQTAESELRHAIEEQLRKELDKNKDEQNGTDCSSGSTNKLMAENGPTNKPPRENGTNEEFKNCVETLPVKRRGLIGEISFGWTNRRKVRESESTNGNSTSLPAKLATKASGQSRDVNAKINDVTQCQANPGENNNNKTVQTSSGKKTRESTNGKTGFNGVASMPTNGKASKGEAEEERGKKEEKSCSVRGSAAPVPLPRRNTMRRR